MEFAVFAHFIMLNTTQPTHLYWHNYRFRGSSKRTPSHSPYSDRMSQDFMIVPEVQKSLSDAVLVAQMPKYLF